MKLSVVIVYYKVPQFLLQCLDAVFASRIGFDMEVWVVDNHSQDDAQQQVASLFPQVHWIANTQNLGFAKANNQALRQAKGQYTLLLNPDVIIDEDCLQAVCDFADAAPNMGAVGLRMIDRYGRFLPESKRGEMSLLHVFGKFSHLGRLFPHSRSLNGYYYPQLDAFQSGEVPVLPGAFMLINRRQLQDDGLLDERFFMYGEDVDLSYRIRRCGFKNYYYPYTIVHYKGESSPKRGIKFYRCFYGAMNLFYQKYETNVFKRCMVSMLTRIISTFSWGAHRTRQVSFAKPTLVVSRQNSSYADIIRTIEREGSTRQVAVYHPAYKITLL